MASQSAAAMPVPNYVDPDSRGSDLIIFGTIFVFLAAVAVVLRFWAHVTSRIFAPDDVSILIAWANSLALTVILNISSSDYGWNRHIIDVPIDWIHHAGEIGYASKILYALAVAFTRLSILLFYYRLSAGTTWTRAYRRFLHGAVAAVVIVCFVQVFMSVFQCSPIWAYYTYPSPPGAHCREEGHELFAFAVLSCVLDATLIALPIPIIWRLKMRLRQRLEAIALLAVGFVATTATCCRAYYIWNLWKGTKDYSWMAYPVFVTTDLEINLGIICGCAPHIRPLFKQWVQAFKKKRVSSSPSSSDGPHPDDDVPPVASLRIYQGAGEV